jgi:7,8-didemethyl-8-hydroxy-5-deazariboflavin synthase CofG subunit
MTKRAPSGRGQSNRRLTFAWTFPLVLTHRCAFRCGYCPFPETAGPALPSKSTVQQSLAFARSLGLVQVRVTAGEGLENHPDIVSTYRFYGFKTFTDYVRSLIGEMAQNGVVAPLFPELDLGGLSLFQMQRLRSYIFTLRLFLDSMDPNLQHSVVHGHAKAKWAKNRVEALVTAGRLGIPVNSGTMIGIGERPETRESAFRVLGELASRYGHIQSVMIRPFEPQPRTQMSHRARPSVNELLEAVALARKMLPAEVAVQFPITHCPERAMDFVEAGATDLGDFELSEDAHRNAANINAYKIARDRLTAAGVELTDRLSLFPAYSNPDWMTERYQELLRSPILAGSRNGDSEKILGLA